jgi:pimeloyl-ACP methyl ester carboxylesterase
MTGRMMAAVLAPVATLLTASGPGRSLFFAMERSRPWKLPSQDSRQLLLNFATASAYEDTVLASMFDIPTGLERITCPVLIMQGTADPLVTMQSPRFLAFIPPRAVQMALRLQPCPHLRRPRARHRAHARFPQRHSGRAHPAGISPSISVTNTRTTTGARLERGQTP